MTNTEDCKNAEFKVPLEGNKVMTFYSQSFPHGGTSFYFPLENGTLATVDRDKFEEALKKIRDSDKNATDAEVVPGQEARAFAVLAIRKYQQGGVEMLHFRLRWMGDAPYHFHMKAEDFDKALASGGKTD